MRYFYPRKNSIQVFGKSVTTTHPLVRTATEYTINDISIYVIQQKFDPETKSFYWSALDPDLANDIYRNEHFLSYFRQHASESFIFIPVRKIMWALRMRPLEKEWWETDF